MGRGHDARKTNYCKFGNFCVTFISQFFHFRIISVLLNSRMNALVVNEAYRNSLLARTLNLQDNEFANISEN